VCGSALVTEYGRREKAERSRGVESDANSFTEVKFLLAQPSAWPVT
jgi:hypothetical protein